MVTAAAHCTSSKGSLMARLWLLGSQPDQAHVFAPYERLDDSQREALRTFSNNLQVGLLRCGPRLAAPPNSQSPCGPCCGPLPGNRKVSDHQPSQGARSSSQQQQQQLQQQQRGFPHCSATRRPKAPSVCSIQYKT